MVQSRIPGTTENFGNRDELSRWNVPSIYTCLNLHEVSGDNDVLPPAMLQCSETLNAVTQEVLREPHAVETPTAAAAHVECKHSALPRDALHCHPLLPL